MLPPPLGVYVRKILTKSQKPIFNLLSTFDAVDKYLSENLSIPDSINYNINLDEFLTCEFDNEVVLKHSSKCRRCGKSTYYCICQKYDSDAADGSFFTSFVEDDDCDSYCNMFDEPA